MKPCCIHLHNGDGAKALKAAAEFLGWCVSQGTPFVAESNGVIERVIRLLLDGVRTILDLRGLDTQWWPWAAKFWRLVWNIRKINGMSPWLARHDNVDFKGKEVPFGALIGFRPPSNVLKKLYKFAPRSILVFFLATVFSQGGNGAVSICAPL